MSVSRISCLPLVYVLLNYRAHNILSPVSTQAYNKVILIGQLHECTFSISASVWFLSLDITWFISCSGFRTQVWLKRYKRKFASHHDSVRSIVPTVHTAWGNMQSGIVCQVIDCCTIHNLYAFWLNWRFSNGCQMCTHNAHVDLVSID